MMYQKSKRLPAERASKLGHLEVIKSPLIKKLCENFEDPEYLPKANNLNWEKFPDANETPLKFIFSVDGSLQTIEQKTPPFKALSFVKSALLKLDLDSLNRLDKNSPNPFALRDIMRKSAQFHATVFPLRHVNVEGKTIKQAIREVIFESIKDDSLEGEMLETLKWLAYEKWNESPLKQLEKFGCPHCKKNEATLDYDMVEGSCPNCNQQIFITDSFTLHQSIEEDYAPNQIASDYMAISESLLIFTPIRYYWDRNRYFINKCLFIKDGPLYLRATLAKYSGRIRNFFKYAKEKGIEVAMIGQEKSGDFYDHLQLLLQGSNNSKIDEKSIFIPDLNYIKKEIKHNETQQIYGADTNYGAKVFIKYSNYHSLVLNIPTGIRGESVQHPSIDKLIGINKILPTISSILSNRFEGAILPIELSNGIASLSTYPSAKSLELYAEALNNNR